MIEINSQFFNPLDLTVETIIKQVLQHKEMGQSDITFYWDQTQLSQDQLLEIYMPITNYAQSIGLNVNCLMSVREAKRLVRYPKMMFVDPLFLLKFKFKTIRFDLIDIKKINA